MSSSPLTIIMDTTQQPTTLASTTHPSAALEGDRSRDNQHEKERQYISLIGCLITVTVLMILFCFIFWKRSNIRRFFKQKNKAIVVKMIEYRREYRRNAITEDTYDNIFNEDFKSKYLKSEIYTIDMEECTDGVSFTFDLDKYEMNGREDVKEKTTNKSADQVDQSEFADYQISKKTKRNPYENVEIAVRSKTDEIKRRHDVVKEIEVVRTFSSGKLPRRNNLQTKIPEFTCSDPHYAVPVVTPKTDIQPFEAGLNTNDEGKLESPYQVPTGENERQRSVEHLDGLLNELDVVYKKTKEQKMSEYYKRVLQTPVEKEQKNNNVGEKETSITVAIFAEKDGKMYFPPAKLEKVGRLDEK
ncbi:uncharacterized protein [Clytia hemisphaerica]|uniref:Uncharacterized protein n=1 Tax=Clytia hemisphaerica TaxID=252671 RepID=A0A7M5VFL9_9CNID